MLRGEGVVEGTPLRNGGPQLHAAQQGDEICVRRAAAAPQGQNLPSIHGRFVVLGPEVRLQQVGSSFEELEMTNQLFSCKVPFCASVSAFNFLLEAWK